MKVLVTFGSKMGGTAGIAYVVGGVLADAGLDVTVVPAETAPDPAGFEAVVVGGAIYASRWHPDARRFVARHAAALATRPVWFFSSGPLDDDATEREIPPPHHVGVWIRRLGVRDHITFGGRLLPEARGSVAHELAKHAAGDWRDMGQVRSWARGIAAALAPVGV
jgi:menaquinone-dependent protoporphyrinogen oxidase